MNFAICSIQNFWKFLLLLSSEILLLCLFSLSSFHTHSLFSPSIFSTETLFFYQWRTFIYFFPIKFYRMRALHLKVFFTELENVDIRFKGNTISKYLRFSYLFYSAKIISDTLHSFISLNIYYKYITNF